MNEFVNFQKRGIELPPGCKDLIDVLHYKDLGGVLPSQNEADSSAEGLSHIEHYLLRLLQSKAQRRSLWINSAASPYINPTTLGLISKNGALLALIFMPRECVSSIRNALNQAGIQLSQDDAIAGDGPFHRFMSCQFPAEAKSAARFVRDLLLNGYGLPFDVELDFGYREKGIA